MSDIPQARDILRLALKEDRNGMRRAIRAALRLMRRRSPDFRHRAEYPKLTPKQRRRARSLRRNGMSMNAITYALKTNLGRVSEAIHPK